jgi:hypothetical protein
MSSRAKQLMLGTAVLWLVIGQAASSQAGSEVYVVARDYSGSNGPISSVSWT